MSPAGLPNGYRYPALASPLDVGPRTMRNRIVQAPLSVSYQDQDGRVTDRTIAHYARRARGGVGMVITENFAVDLSGRQMPRQGLADGEEYLPGLAKLAASVRAEGALAVLQLVHAGRYAGPWEEYGARRRLAPSATSFELTPGRMVTPDEITLEEMSQVIESFSSATRLAVRAGFDGVQLHGAQGFLLSEFMSPRMNQRTDAFGGDITGRTAFVLETVDAVVAAAAGQILVGFHLLSDEGMPGGWGPDDAAWLADRLSGRGVDFISPVPSTFESLRARLAADPASNPSAYDAGAVSGIRDRARVPVFVNGGVGHPERAEHIVGSGAGDAVMLGRALLTDPDWAVKVLAGKTADIASCDCNPPTCLRTQLTGTICHTWPAADIDRGFVG
jgi:2,4-dienoyl-CoA reductase (NADPH2)